MKRTEIERIERELWRAAKKETRLEPGAPSDTSVGAYIERLFGLFRFDNNEIFNASEDMKILELLEEMKAHVPAKKWDDVLKKAIKKTRVEQKDKAMNELKQLIGDN